MGLNLLGELVGGIFLSSRIRPCVACIAPPATQWAAGEADKNTRKTGKSALALQRIKYLIDYHNSYGTDTLYLRNEHNVILPVDLGAFRTGCVIEVQLLHILALVGDMLSHLLCPGPRVFVGSFEHLR